MKRGRRGRLRNLIRQQMETNLTVDQQEAMAAHVPDILEFAEGLVLGYNQEFSFEGREWLKQIMHDTSSTICMLKSRQVGWSVMLSIMMCWYALRYPGVQIMYCTMRVDQFRYFSRRRLRPILDAYGVALSPAENRIKSMQLSNGSLITLVSGHDDFDQSRGYPIDILFLDEAERLPIHALVNIKETMAASKINRIYIGGTGGIEGHPWPEYWKKTTQQTWDKQTSKWTARQPDADIVSYHVTQRMLPNWTQEREDAKRRDAESIAEFEMEVLGVHTNLLSVPLPETVVKECMLADTPWAVPSAATTHGRKLCAAIDLAAGGENSDTVVAIMDITDNDNIIMLEAVRSDSKLASDIMRDISPVLDRWSPDVVVSDAGGNDELLALLSNKYDNLRKYRLGPQHDPVMYPTKDKTRRIRKYPGTTTDEIPISKTFFVQRVITRFYSHRIVIPEAENWLVDQITAITQESREQRTGGTSIVFDKIKGRKNDLLMCLTFAECMIYEGVDDTNPANRKATWGITKPKW